MRKNIFSHMRKFIFVRTEISFLPHGAKFPFEGREIFLRKTPKFPSARKYFFFRKEINFLAEGIFLLCARKFCALPSQSTWRAKKSKLEREEAPSP